MRTEVLEHADPAMPHGHGDGRADPDRGVLHDETGELEHDLGESVEPFEHDLLRPPPHLGEANPNRIDQKTICKTSLLTAAANTLSGTMSSGSRRAFASASRTPAPPWPRPRG